MSESVLQLDPAKVLAEDNIRFNLKATAIEAMKASILERGGVLEPVLVAPLSPVVKGCTHKLVAGFIRHAASVSLNAEQNAGVTLPAIIVQVADDLDRQKIQIEENLRRESMSPMDKATAIKKLLDRGVERGEIRRLFAAVTGKKALTSQPMSNAMMNILLRFLELPKAIQDKIHDGRVGVEAAYILGKVTPDRRAAVLERAEKERVDAIEALERDEEKFLNTERKLNEAETKVAESEKTAETLRAEIAAAEAKAKERADALDAVKKEPYLELKPEEKDKLRERMKAAETDHKASLKIVKDLKNDLAKLLKSKDEAAELAAKRKAELEAARKLKKADKGRGKGGAIGTADIKNAAGKEGVAVGYVPMNLADIRQGLKELATKTIYKEGTKDIAIPDRVGAAILAVKHWADGRSTVTELVNDLNALTTNKPVPKHLVVAEAPADKPAEPAAPAPAPVHPAKAAPASKK